MQGKRYALPNTRIMLHHPSGSARGQASDIHNEARELMRLRNYVNRVLSQATGKPIEKVHILAPVSYTCSRGPHAPSQGNLQTSKSRGIPSLPWMHAFQPLQALPQHLQRRLSQCKACLRHDRQQHALVAVSDGPPRLEAFSCMSCV